MKKSTKKIKVKDYLPNVGFIQHDTMYPLKNLTPNGHQCKSTTFPKKYGFNFPKLILN